MPSERSIFKLHNCDVRELPKVLETHGYSKKFIDVTITSPPYFNLKSYGYKNQIGYGQKYLQYLDDLREVFKHVYFATRDTGSLWIIIDTFSKGHTLVNLPFEISEKLKNIVEKNGWNLTDLIIWKKDKTLPWSRKGQFRNIFEFILFFTKSNKYKFYIDRTRVFDFSKMKQWWVKFPERYNPKGMAPTNVWEYPIPTQGTWSRNSLRHFNPLPSKMIETIVLLTTDPGDVVFDPFAGSGVTLSVADFLKRKWFGFEMNPKYCEMFEKNVMNETRQELMIERNGNTELEALKNQFEQTIKNLRQVKYPKSLMRELYRRKILISSSRLVDTIFALSRKLPNRNLAKISVNKFMFEDIFLILKNHVETDFLRKQILEVISRPPLSKFGIESRVFLQTRDEFLLNQKNTLAKLKMWLYTFGVVHKFERTVTLSEWISQNIEPQRKMYLKEFMPPIISNIRVNQEIPESWEPREQRQRDLKDKYNMYLTDFAEHAGTK
jgi:DNA modification methylase